MSTLKTIYLQHLNGSGINATLDANGNMTVTGTVCGASSNMFRNRIINGDMRIDQRNAGASTTPSGITYNLDRWHLNLAQSSKVSVQQNAGSVTPPAGFSNYVGITSLSSYSIVSGDYHTLRQSIEGYNIADLAMGTASAKSITLSFWVRSSLTGTFGGSVNSGDYGRSYAFTYTISSSNTWEYKTIIIPGDTTGTYSTNNSAGMHVGFQLGTGSTYTTTAGAWTSGTYLGATGATSLLGTNSATLYITGVQLEAGAVATPFEYRHYGHELALCQRYYEKSYDPGVVPGTSGTPNGYMATHSSPSYECWHDLRFKVEKRAAPTITAYSAQTGASGKGYIWNSSSDKTAFCESVGTSGAPLIVVSVGAGGYQDRTHWTAVAEL